MTRPVTLALSLALGAGLSLGAAQLARTRAGAAKPGWTGEGEARHYTLPNGWRVSPAGTPVALPGDMPANILVLSNDRALVNTCGFHDHGLNLVDLAGGKVLATVGFARGWIGLARDAAGDVLVSGGKADDPAKYPAIHRVALEGDALKPLPAAALDAVADPKGRFVSNMLSGPRGLYVLNIQTDEVLLLDPEGKPAARTSVGYRPYAAALSPDGATLAVSEWGRHAVVLLDAATLAFKDRIEVAAHPTALAYLPDGRLFVANAGTDALSVVAGNRVAETVRTGLGLEPRVGSTPLALAPSPDGRTIYVANAGDNVVTVLDVARPGATKTRGLIPTERYPSALAVTPDGRRLLVGTAKGYYGPNLDPRTGPNEESKGEGAKNAKRRSYRYVGEQLAGRLAILDVPDAPRLAALTRQAREGRPLGERAALDPAGRRRIERGAFAKIRHVIYVIKENRTYDAVLGDLPQGNGDPSLTTFGRRVTPNIHRLAETYGLLDNLYTDGEVSQCGHQWADAAYANDYTEKAWILSYSRHGEVESDRRLTSSPGDYLWTAARKRGRTARVYGEYVDVQEDHGSLEDPKIKADPETYGYSASFERIFARDGRDTEKVADFLRELKTAEGTGKWPDLMVMALPEDHTHGLSAGRHTPEACVGSNDLAVGRLVEGVSHSRFWKETAIFVIEDDAQDGPDHVDSHRTTGLVISPYTRRGPGAAGVDSTMYSTASMLRTMEILLGLPPMTTYDANATPMHAAFTDRPDFAPYAALPPGVDLEARNPGGTSLARRSARLDFSDVDRADPAELNRILWEHAKPGVPYPARAGLRASPRAR